MSDFQLVIYAKNPLIGKVKTRLARGCNRRFATRAYLTLLHETVAALATIANVTIAVSPNTRNGSILALCRHYPVTLRRQPNGDLGQRMARSIRLGLKHSGAVAIVGTDCPELNADAIQRVKQQLTTHRSSLIPADDGGYVLVGCRDYQPLLFQQVRWSSSQVMKQTQRQARRLRQRLPDNPAMTDIDHLASWHHARRRNLVGPLWRRKRMPSAP